MALNRHILITFLYPFHRKRHDVDVSPSASFLTRSASLWVSATTDLANESELLNFLHNSHSRPEVVRVNRGCRNAQRAQMERILGWRLTASLFLASIY